MYPFGSRTELNGQIWSTWVAVGAVPDSNTVVKYRIDDRKMQVEIWSRSTEGNGVFPLMTAVNDLIFGHIEKQQGNMLSAATSGGHGLILHPQVVPHFADSLLKLREIHRLLEVAARP